MVNVVTIGGRLGKDVELRRTNSGIAVASFSLACDRDFTTQDGKRETDWVNVVAWRQTAEFCAKYFQKGSSMIVTGRLQTRSWTDENGDKRYTTEVVADRVYFSGSKKDEAKSAEPGSYGNDFAVMEDNEEELPF